MSIIFYKLVVFWGGSVDLSIIKRSGIHEFQPNTHIEYELCFYKKKNLRFTLLPNIVNVKSFKNSDIQMNCGHAYEPIL